jgi:hypothetical protein
MTQPAQTPKVHPGGLVTVAFLKAQLDEGSDHLGIFMPLLLDTAAQLPAHSFTTADIQEALAGRHKLVMPEQTLATLLKRATRKSFLQRDSGRYLRGPSFPSLPDVAAEKARIEAGQERLAQALQSHAARRNLAVQSNEAALQLLFRFLEEEQVSLLLGVPAATEEGSEPTLRERAVVAEFVQDAIRDDPAFRAVLNDILEGLVLYRAAFLPDLDARSRKFNNLKVFFDSVLVRQALGYEGTAMRILLRETIDVLKTSGVRCLVLDKSVHEIKRILGMYEVRMATDEGRRSLRPVPMARHFLTQRYSPGDIREMAALLEGEVVAAGFQIRAMPRRVPEFTASERALAARLADPLTQDELAPRVVHDVDCVAAILVFRGAHRSSTIEDAGAVFATSSPLVIRNARLWWQDDERETGTEPIVHIRALANLAWLKKPKLSGEFKERELVALCTAALRPTPATWRRFLKHLDVLQKSNKITSNEIAAVLVSAMSDRLLRDVEEDDPSDIDAATLDEVVERVKESYGARADARVQEVAGEYERRLADLEAKARAESERASAAERTASESTRKRELAIDGRARTYARGMTRGVSWIVSTLVIAGALALIVGHPFHPGWLGVALGVAVVVFVLLELIGILRHVSDWRSSVETRLTRRFRTWLGGDAI